MAGSRGRPPSGEFKGKSAVFTTRIRPELRDRLAESAESNGRSLSQEVERRLSDSFRLEDRMEYAFGSVENFWLMRMIALAINNAQITHQEGERWRNDPEAFDATLKIVNGVLEALRPGPAPQTTNKKKEANNFWQTHVAVTTLESIYLANPDLPINEGSDTDHVLASIKRKLGEDAPRALQRVLFDAPSLEDWDRRIKDAEEADRRNSGDAAEGQTSK
ncbi:Arc family DNA-binding protein [Methylobacterium terrae]|nr:Arc family DNA-binding protein [Methylobacterium terrae]